MPLIQPVVSLDLGAAVASLQSSLLAVSLQALDFALLDHQTASNWDRRRRISNIAGTASFTVWLFAQSPQLYENYRRKSVSGLSGVFLTQWIVADILNLVGAFLTHQLPFQIAVAAYFCCVDCVIIFQWIRYSRLNPPPKLSRPKFERHHTRQLFHAHSTYSHTQAHRSATPHKYRSSMSQSLTLTRPALHQQQPLLSSGDPVGQTKYASTASTVPLDWQGTDGSTTSRRAQSHPVRTTLRTLSESATRDRTSARMGSVRRGDAPAEAQVLVQDFVVPDARTDAEIRQDALSASRARSRSKASLTMTAGSTSTVSSRSPSPDPYHQQQSSVDVSRSTSPARGRSTKAHVSQVSHASHPHEGTLHHYQLPLRPIASRSPSASSSYRVMTQEALRVALLAERLEERRSRRSRSRTGAMAATDAGGYFSGKYNNLGMSVASSQGESGRSSRRPSSEEHTLGQLATTSIKGKTRDYIVNASIETDERELADGSGFTITGTGQATARPSPAGSQSPSGRTHSSPGETESFPRSSTEVDHLLPLIAKPKGTRRVSQSRVHSGNSDLDRISIAPADRNRSRKRKAGSAVAGIFSLLGIGSLIGLGEVGAGVGFCKMPMGEELSGRIASSPFSLVNNYTAREWRHPVMLYPLSHFQRSAASVALPKSRSMANPLERAPDAEEQGEGDNRDEHRHHRHDPPPTIPPPAGRNPAPNPSPGSDDPDWPGRHPTVNFPLLIGRIASWICTILYTTSRLPQLYLNARRRSVEGLSILLFMSAFMGNSLYSISILASPEAVGEDAREYLRESMPFLLGSGGTLVFDAVIVLQWWMWGKVSREEEKRGRGDADERGMGVGASSIDV